MIILNLKFFSEIVGILSNNKLVYVMYEKTLTYEITKDLKYKILYLRMIEII